MFELIEGFPRQLLHALELIRSFHLHKHPYEIHNIIISGLGGSGIGGHAVIELAAKELKVPVVVNNSYHLPNFANQNTLIVLSSYSGNTEEIIQVGKEVKAKNLEAVCITSGGKLKALADSFGWQSLIIPAGMPPRAGFGYSVTFQLFILQQQGLISSEFMKKSLIAAELLSQEQQEIKSLAQKVAASLKHKFIALFADQWFHSLVVRAKQQLNENSKSLCWANVFPEMNHNELVAWRGNKENLSILFFRSNWENERNQHRIAFSKEIIKGTGAEVIELFAKGSSHFEQYFYHTHLTDWISYYLAQQQQFDPLEIDVLNRLKNYLASIQ